MTPRELDELLLIRDACLPREAHLGRSVGGAIRKAILFAIWTTQGVPITLRALSVRACCGEQQVYLGVNSLVTDGVLVRSQIKGHRSTFAYTISFERLAEIQEHIANVLPNVGYKARTPVHRSRASAEEVRTARKRSGLSQASLGALIGVSKHAVQNWEQGKKLPSAINQAKLQRFATGGLGD